MSVGYFQLSCGTLQTGSRPNTVTEIRLAGLGFAAASHRAEAWRGTLYELLF